MFVQLNKDQREYKCSTCSQSELGYRVVYGHTARIHQEIDEGLADANAIEQNVYDANDDIIFEDNNAIDAIELEDMDYLEGEEDVDEYEANDNFASNDTKLFNISENEALPYFIMIFLTFFQANNLTITATESLFKFMNAILFLLGINYAFPSKLQTIKSKISANYASKDIKKYIVCEKCNAIYVYEEVIDNSNTIKKCSNRTLPSYANGMRARCNHPLVVKNASNDSVKPIKRYAYNSVKATLMKFFMRPTFEQKIEEWRSKTVMPGMMFDIFDGRFFKEFKKDDEDEPFLQKEGSLMLSLNVDWFTPTQGMKYHVGAIYLIINNLPRNERFKKQNMILVGLMPGPREAALSEINHFLRPMVDELLELYDGIIIPTYMAPNGRMIRCALASVNCDLPAVKKVCGFTAINSFVPCHKCADTFPARTDNPVQRCFSNVDCSSWRLRDRHSNYEQALLWKNASTKLERRNIEQKYGVRWSELHRLHYFDIIRCNIIDGLHNLYLGTAKRMIQHWIKPKSNGQHNIRPFLTSNDLAEMAEEAKNIIVPPRFTPLSSKISANFSDMKGDEFRSWILVYSPILLKGRLTGEHMINWMRFVDANRILASPSITHYEVNQAHNLLVEFVRTNVMLYGEDFITPNMHFHLHIHQTIEDFGPLYSTWLYSFERTNGDIKAIDINYKEGLEFTYMEKYIQQVHMQDYINILPSVISSNPVMMNTLRLLLPNNERQAYDTNDGNEDDMMETDNSEMHSPTTFDVSAFLNNAISASIVLTGSEPLPPSSYPIKTKKEVFMNSDHYECLFQFYSSVYGNFNVLKMSNISSSLSSSSIIVSNLINKFDQINILGQQFTSLECRNRRGIYIQAMTPAQEGIFRIGRILYFFTHELSFPNDHSIFNTRSTKKHVFAFVQWYQPSSQEFTSFYPHHVEVWKRTFEPISALSILPVQQINTCVAVTTYVDNNILAIPLPRRIVGV